MKKVKIEIFRPALEHDAFMRRRVSELVHHYGRCITHMPIESLAMSCYSQGVEDCLQLINKTYAVNTPNTVPH